MTRWTSVLGAVALMACNKGGDSGNAAEIPADCDDFMTALAECYATGGFELSDGGIDAEAWCLAEEETGVSAEVYACRISIVTGGDCTTSEGIATVSDDLSNCDPE